MARTAREFQKSDAISKAEPPRRDSLLTEYTDGGTIQQQKDILAYLSGLGSTTFKSLQIGLNPRKKRINLNKFNSRTGECRQPL